MINCARETSADGENIQNWNHSVRFSDVSIQRVLLLLQDGILREARVFYLVFWE